MSTLYVDNLQPNLGSQVEIPDLKPLAGSVLQVKQTYFGTQTSSSASQVYIPCTDSDCTLTATQDNSKFLIRVILSVYMSGAKPVNVGIYRGATLIAGTAGASGDEWAGAFNTSPSNSTDSDTIIREYLDSPSLTAGTSVTYKAGLGLWNGAGSIYINYSGYSIKSSVVVQEIAQ